VGPNSNLFSCDKEWLPLLNKEKQEVGKILVTVETVSLERAKKYPGNISD
jgi:hypothetical protein